MQTPVIAPQLPYGSIPLPAGLEAAALAEWEWEVDNILLVFSGLKQWKVHLFQETLEFFEFEMPNRLSDSEKVHLSEATSRKEPREDVGEGDIASEGPRSTKVLQDHI